MKKILLYGFIILGTIGVLVLYPRYVKIVQTYKRAVALEKELEKYSVQRDSFNLVIEELDKKMNLYKDHMKNYENLYDALKSKNSALLKELQGLKKPTLNKYSNEELPEILRKHAEYDFIMDSLIKR